jgi:hypothetical protein
MRGRTGQAVAALVLSVCSAADIHREEEYFNSVLGDFRMMLRSNRF